MLKRDINGFLSAIAETPRLWNSIDFRVMAVWADGAWQNMVARGRLDARLPHEVPGVSDLPDLPQPTVLQEVFPIDTLPSLLARMRAGKVTVGGRAVQFRSSEDAKFSRPYDMSYVRRGLSTEGYDRGPFGFGHVLFLSGGSAWEFFRRFAGDRGGIDALLRRAGWLSLNELLLRGLGDVLALDTNMPARASFVAPLEASLVREQCSWRGGSLVYKVLAGSADAGRHAILTVAGEAKGGRFVREVPLATAKWAREKPFVRTVGKLRLPKASSVDVMLHLRGFEVGCERLIEQGERATHSPLLKMAHDSLFTKRRSFEQFLLATQSGEGREFERAVAKLFGYCGFPSDQPGKVPQEQNGPDVLVEVPERNLLLVIETTIAHLMNDDGKMNRLTKRTADVRLALKGTGAQVVPVLVLPWARETFVPVEMEEAEKNGVRVLGREDLENLLSMALRREPLRRIAHHIVPEARAPATSAWLRGERNPMA